MHPDRCQCGRRISFRTRGKNFHLGPAGLHGPDHLLDMNGAALSAENRDAEVGTEVSNAHQLTSFCATTCLEFAVIKMARRRWLFLRMSNSASIKWRPRIAKRIRSSGSSNKRCMANAKAAG